MLSYLALTYTSHYSHHMNPRRSISIIQEYRLYIHMFTRVHLWSMFLFPSTECNGTYNVPITDCYSQTLVSQSLVCVHMTCQILETRVYLKCCFRLSKVMMMITKLIGCEKSIQFQYNPISHVQPLTYFFVHDITMTPFLDPIKCSRILPWSREEMILIGWSNRQALRMYLLRSHDLAAVLDPWMNQSDHLTSFPPMKRDLMMLLLQGLLLWMLWWKKMMLQNVDVLHCHPWYWNDLNTKRY